MQNNLNIKPIISVALVILLSFTIIGVIGGVLTPFIVALILAYILNPLVENLTKKFNISRDFIGFLMAGLVFLIFFTIPVFVLPTFINQLKN